MKMADTDRKALENMQAGIITANGFLGTDTRSLPDIIESDEEHFRKLGLDWDAVADRMTELLELGKEGLGEPITIKDKWLVHVDETRGKLPSPWEDGLFHKVNAEVSKLENGVPDLKPVVFNELSVFLLKKHHFLQGKGSPFRLEADRIADVVMI